MGIVYDRNQGAGIGAAIGGFSQGLQNAQSLALTSQRLNDMRRAREVAEEERTRALEERQAAKDANRALFDELHGRVDRGFGDGAAALMPGEQGPPAPAGLRREAFPEAMRAKIDGLNSIYDRLPPSMQGQIYDQLANEAVAHEQKTRRDRALKSLNKAAAHVADDDDSVERFIDMMGNAEKGLVTDAEVDLFIDDELTRASKRRVHELERRQVISELHEQARAMPPGYREAAQQALFFGTSKEDMSGAAIRSRFLEAVLEADKRYGRSDEITGETEMDPQVAEILNRGQGADRLASLSGAGPGAGAQAGEEGEPAPVEGLRQELANLAGYDELDAGVREEFVSKLRFAIQNGGGAEEVAKISREYGTNPDSLPADVYDSLFRVAQSQARDTGMRREPPALKDVLASPKMQHVQSQADVDRVIREMGDDPGHFADRYPDKYRELVEFAQANKAAATEDFERRRQEFRDSSSPAFRELNTAEQRAMQGDPDAGMQLMLRRSPEALRREQDLDAQREEAAAFLRGGGR